ncbi:MAG: ABC transporter ATP-binding protein/permease [Oscillospiraceae bacterium]|nr:ABC transporter ATP-binding protein/permease [Oscillospiraceae bacterium]
MKNTLSQLRSYKKQLILGPLCKLIEAVLELTMPLIMARMIDNRAQGMSLIIRYSLIMLAVAAVGLGFALVCQYYASRASQGFGTKLRAALMQKISSLSPAQVQSFGASSLTNRLTSDVNQLQTAVAMMIRLASRAPFLCIGASIMAMSIDLPLSVILIVLIPLFILVLYLILSRSLPLFTKLQGGLDRLALLVGENLSGVRVIRAFNNAPRQRESFTKSNGELYSTYTLAGRLSALMNPATALIMNGAICAVLWFGGFSVKDGRLTTGEVIAYINYLTQIMLQMIIVSNLMVLFSKAYAGGKRVEAVLQTQPDICSPAKPEPIGKNKNAPAIEFENVSFAYRAGANALEGINFALQGGEALGIIGGTGSGKSTLLSLVDRLYDASEGTVKIWGTDVRRCDLTQLRSQMAIVEQEPSLLSGSIRSNLQYGNSAASDTELIEALKLAQAWEFVEKLPKGLDSSIERGGRNLSGGQRQRLAIARAIAAKRPILMLDDASSALDYATDSKLKAALNTLDCTTVIVAQRVKSVYSAQSIVCLENGRIAGMGTHEELFDTCREYREICDSQGVGRGGKLV